MDILRKEIRLAPKKLSRAYGDFLKFVRGNPDALVRGNFEKSGLLDYDVGHVQAWPALIDRRMTGVLEEAGVGLFNLIKSIPRRIFNNDLQAMSRYYGVPIGDVEGFCRGTTQAHVDRFISRADFIFTESGPRCLEYNIAGCLGGLWDDVVKDKFYQNPIIARFLEERPTKFQDVNVVDHLFRHMLETVENRFDDLGNEINFAFVLMDLKDKQGLLKGVDRYSSQQYRRILEEPFNGVSLKGEIFFCDGAQLSYRDNYVYCEGKRICAVIDMYNGVELPRGLLDAYEAGNVFLFNGPLSPLVSSKLNIALLSEHLGSDLFDDGEKEIIRKYVPWSRRIVPGQNDYMGTVIDMEEFLILNRPRLVIKPSMGLGGNDVFVGRYVPEIQWNGLVKVALEEGTRVVQEYVEPVLYVFQSGEEGCGYQEVVWGIFVFGSNYGGGFLRMKPHGGDRSGVINVSQGAEMTPIFEVDED